MLQMAATLITPKESLSSPTPVLTQVEARPFSPSSSYLLYIGIFVETAWTVNRLCFLTIRPQTKVLDASIL
jgi:hypothetical protein